MSAASAVAIKFRGKFLHMQSPKMEQACLAKQWAALFNFLSTHDASQVAKLCMYMRISSTNIPQADAFESVF